MNHTGLSRTIGEEIKLGLVCTSKVDLCSCHVTARLGLDFIFERLGISFPEVSGETTKSIACLPIKSLSQKCPGPGDLPCLQAGQVHGCQLEQRDRAIHGMVEDVKKRFVLLIFLSPHRSFPHGIGKLYDRKLYTYSLFERKKAHAFFNSRCPARRKQEYPALFRQKGGVQG